MDDFYNGLMEIMALNPWIYKSPWMNRGIYGCIWRVPLQVVSCKRWILEDWIFWSTHENCGCEWKLFHCWKFGEGPLISELKIMAEWWRKLWLHVASGVTEFSVKYMCIWRGSWWRMAVHHCLEKKTWDTHVFLCKWSV